MTAAFTRPKVNPPRFFGCVSPKQQGEGGEVFTNEAADGDEPDILFLYQDRHQKGEPSVFSTQGDCSNEAADGDEPDILFLYEIHSFRRRPRLMNTT